MCNQEWRGNDEVAEMYAEMGRKQKEAEDKAALVITMLIVALLLCLFFLG